MNKEQLKEAVDQLACVDTVFQVDGVSYIDTAVSAMQVYDLIDQLDEPEALSQKWIDENKKDSGAHYIGYYVPIDRLHGLFVPKQEVTQEQVMHWIDNNDFYDHRTAETVLANAVDKGELGYYGTKYSVVKKPVIPKYVAEWIAKHRDTFDLYPALKKLEDKPAAWKPWKRIYEWYRMNTHQFVNAYLTGEYEVEEEQKYYVMNNHNEMMLVRMMDGKTITEADPFKLEDMYEDEKKLHRLTEKEIKDYDERFWPFAVEVEE